jgi:hypothetical protein
MQRIVIPDAVRDACAEDPELAASIATLRARAEFQLDADRDIPMRFAIGNSSAWGRGPDRRFASIPPRGQCDSPPSIAGCFGPENKRLCDMQRVSVGVIVGGGAVFNLQMEPTNSAWFEPLAIRATVVDAENVTLNSRLLVTAVTLNDCPLESTNDIAPVAPALVNNTRFNGWWTDDWQDPDVYAVAVSWPWFSDLSNKLPLRIIGIAFGIPAASFVAATFTLYGNAAPSRPPT